VAEASRYDFQEEDVLNPLHFIKNNEEESEENICKRKEREQKVLIYWLSEWMAHTERDASHNHLEN